MLRAASILFPLLVSASIAAAVLALAGTRPSPRPARGPVGQARRRARRHAWFRIIDLPLRALAAQLRAIPGTRWRRHVELCLLRGGSFLGLSADEFVALHIVTGVIAATGAVVLTAVTEVGAVPLGSSIALLTGLPALELRSTIRRRAKSVDRTLPAAIDVTAMCMGAGLDLPRALREVVRTSPPDAPLAVELDRVLQELALGHTRAGALARFAERVPTDAVRELASAVTQAEEKGTPLAQILAQQAARLRDLRSIKAEEAAARAGVLLMAPLMMLFGCVLILVLGPILIDATGGSL